MMDGLDARSEFGKRGPIVFLSTWHPEPVDNGQKQRIRGMIDAVAERFDVAVISLLPPDEISDVPLPAIPRVCQQWALPLPKFNPRSPAAIVAGMRITPRSFVVTWDAGTARQIVRICRHIGASAVIGIDMRTARFLSAVDTGVRKFLDSPELSFVLPNQNSAGRAMNRWRVRARAYKYKSFLRVVTRQLEAVFVPSELEAAAFRQLSGYKRVLVVENGIGRIPSDPWTAPASNQLLYTGALTYPPNAEAVAHFVREILPRVETQIPDISLAVTGAVPHLIPDGVRHPLVHLTGRVPTLDPVYRESRLAIVPLLSGTGTRIKILETLAAGMPVVTTSKGAEGLDVTSGEHLIISDSPEDFAGAIVRLLRDPDESLRLGRQGRSHVAQRYHWNNIGKRLTRAIEQAVHTEDPIAALSPR